MKSTFIARKFTNNHGEKKKKFYKGPMFVRPAPKVYEVHIHHVYFLNNSHLKLTRNLIYIWVASKIMAIRKDQNP